MRADVYVPLSEGTATSISQSSATLLTRVDPSTGNRLSGEQYLQLVEREREKEVALIQTIVHAAVAAALARRESGPRESCLVAVDGRRQTVGGQKMAGGDIARGVWKDVLEPDMAQSLPPQVTLRWAVGIRDDLHTVFAEVLKGDPARVTILADERYHTHIEQAFADQASASEFSHVITPQQGVEEMQAMTKRLGASEEPSERFVADLARVGQVEPSPSLREKILYGPVHFFSRFLRHIPLLRDANAESATAHLLWEKVGRNGDAVNIEMAREELLKRFPPMSEPGSHQKKRRRSGRAHSRE